jgi:hypothetical protein
MGFQPTLEPEAQGLLSEMQSVQDVRDQMASMRNEQFQAKNLALGLAGMEGSIPIASYINPSYRKVAPELVSAARESRSKIWQALKNDFKNRVAEGTNSFEQRLQSTFFGKRMPKNLAKEYNENVKEVTALPDELIARVKHAQIQPAGKDRVVGWWDEYSKRVGLGLNKSLGTVSHELGGHNGTAYANEIVKKIQTKDTDTIKWFNTLSRDEKTSLVNMSNLESFDRPVFNMMGGSRGKQMADSAEQYYQKNKRVWPSEVAAYQIEKDIPGLASELKQRLSLAEWLRASSKGAAKGIESKQRYFPTE